MTKRNQKVNSLYPNRADEDIECYLCNDGIDKAFGYFNCPMCKLDMCLDCSQARHRNEEDLAENPLLMPTPLADLG
jgi:predicted RNA-binding Zn-ribbon protein involved in translation (DUF1610 family)